MLFRRLFIVFIGALGLLVSVSAQDEYTIADGLNHPRGVAYDAFGTLYIAEAGNGGEFDLGVNQFGDPATLGPTSQLTTVSANGVQSVMMPYLGSYSAEGLGLIRVLPTEDTLWLLFSEGDATMPFAWSAVGLDAFTMRIKHVIDLYTYEQLYNPDGTDEIYNNPHDIASAPDGTLYIVDAGANTIYTWTPEDDLQVFKTWDTNPVPTALAFAPDGTLWVSFLGQQLAPGAGSVEQWSAEGEVLAVYDGLTAVTDVMVTREGTVYFVELFTLGDRPEMPGPGQISSITAEGVTSVVGDLMFPFALAEAPDGSIVASVGTVSFGPELVPGAVVRVIDAP